MPFIIELQVNFVNAENFVGNFVFYILEYTLFSLFKQYVGVLLETC
jgi:hypothetical protein